MKALGVFPGTKEIRIVDHPDPGQPGPHEVLVEILEVGVCGTDKEIAEFLYGAPPRDSDYLVLGHESLGKVVATGPEVSKVKVGDLAVVMVRRPCGVPSCVACAEHRQDFCYTGEFTERGIGKQHGFMTERVIDHEDWVVPVPASLREVGVLVEPLTIAEKALIQVWDMQERLPWECREARQSGRAPRLKALILGAGPVGLLGAMAIAQAGFQTFVYSREPEGSPKARITERFGGEYVSGEDVKPQDLPKAIGAVDLVYEATGASRLAFEVLQVLGPNAVFCFTGVPGRKHELEIETGTLMRDVVLKNQILFGTVNAGRDAFEAAIADLGVFQRDWPEAVSGLITGRYALEKHAELLHGRGGIKNVISLEA